MKALIPLLITLFLVSACTTPTGTRRTAVRDCPFGMVLICETRKDQELSRGGEEEIPEYEFCYCEQIN